MRAALILILWVICLTAALTAGAFAMHMHYQNQPSLPYSESHREFQIGDDDCAAWVFSNGAVVVICEGKPPIMSLVEKECGMTL